MKLEVLESGGGFETIGWNSHDSGKRGTHHPMLFVSGRNDLLRNPIEATPGT